MSRIVDRSKRARNLDEAAIRLIEDILGRWTGPLTWKALIDRIEALMSFRYTRQALHKHERIRQAFARCRAVERQAGGGSRPSAGERKRQMQRFERLTMESERLERENSNIRELLARWLHNARSRGVDEEFLNRPLPPVGARSEEGR